MANNCYYEMMIKGSKENCRKWLRKMKSYDEPNHFWRIFDATVYDEQGTDDEYYINIMGDCAWSLESCCRTSGYSNGVDLFAVNTKELNICMEAYSREEGIGFEEHYIYDNDGICIVEECVDYLEIYWDKNECPDFETYKKEYEISDSVKESDFNEDGYHAEGGFPDWNFSI